MASNVRSYEYNFMKYYVEYFKDDISIFKETINSI